MAQKRGTIGLSIETLVVIIISLVILAGGVTLLYKFISGAEDFKNIIDEKTDAELERLLVDQGKLVALPQHIATVERGNSHVFGLGILNVDASSGNLFTLDILLDKYVNEKNEEEDINSAEVSTWLLYDKEQLPLQESEHRKEPILVNVPKDALKGQYIFTASVFDGNNKLYGNPQKFMVTVK